MMLNDFTRVFKVTSKNQHDIGSDIYTNVPSELYQLFDVFGGCTFNYGLYRIHSFSSSIHWSLRIGEYFPGYVNKVYPFGFDWMGRQFSIDRTRELIFMFDPATMEDFVLHKTINTFHNEDLSNNLLSSELFNSILTFNKIAELDDESCFGYDIPLFLGGKDDLENYQRQDMEVYWDITNQLYNKIKDLPKGTKIGKITLE